MAALDAKLLEVRALEMLELRVAIPRMWKPRLWLASRVFWFGALVAGVCCTIEVANK